MVGKIGIIEMLENGQAGTERDSEARQEVKELTL